MSRHPFLIELSREHHHGLVLARRARRWAGGTADELTSGWEAVRRAYHDELAPHFADEEQRVLPRLLASYPGLVARTLDEHHRLRELAVHGGTPGELWELGELLEAHIRFEERSLFPALEAVLAGEPAAFTGVGAEAT